MPARSAELIGERLGGEFDIAVVLGSGLGAAAERLGDTSMSMADAGFPSTSVVGHAGTISAGTVGGARVLVLAGRVHLYEGHHAHADRARRAHRGPARVSPAAAHQRRRAGSDRVWRSVTWWPSPTT